VFVNEEMLIKVANVLGGEEAVKLVNVLKKLDKATDDELSVKTDVRLNAVRKILYRLYDFSLVNCERLRDEKTGWFIFYWKLQPDQVEGFIQNQKRKVLEKLQARLAYEENHDFYSCLTPTCGRLTFEEALELVFRCPSCGKALQHFDNSRIIAVLKNKIETLQKELCE
jgi:transcription initiation factor TFIIE subunit alpha